jgi:hypothetical protein
MSVTVRVLLLQSDYHRALSESSLVKPGNGGYSGVPVIMTVPVKFSGDCEIA